MHDVVTVGGFSEAGEFAAGGRVEVVAVDDNATHTNAVAADPISAAVDDDFGAQRDGLAEVASRAENVVQDERNASVVGDFCHGNHVGNIYLDCAHFIIDQCDDAFRVLPFN